MLRLIFVSVLLLIGSGLALQGPFYALLLYLWIAYFRPEQWVWTDLFQTIPISFVAGAYLVVRSIFSRTTFRFDLRVVLLLAILLLGMASTFNSEYFEYCQFYLRDFAKALIITYLIAVLASDTSKLRLVILTIAFSLAFESAKQGWVQLILNPGGTNTNELPFLGDNNGVAVGMLMLVPLLIALARSATRRWERWLHLFLSVGVLYRALSTYSRGGFLAAGALGFTFLLRSPRRLRAFAGAALAAAITLSVMPDQFWNRMQTIEVEDGQERDRSSAGRLHFWDVAIDMAEDYPIGVGVNGFTQAYDRYDTSDGAFGRARSVHSAWFGMLAELGFPGLMLFVAIISMAWMAASRARRLAGRDLISKELGDFGAALEMSLVVFAVGGSFVPFQYTEMLWHVVGLTMAVHFLTARQMAEHMARPPAAILPFHIAVPATDAVAAVARVAR
jgi:probable O-glycosylation ligase (exosortase A-associated)